MLLTALLIHFFIPHESNNHRAKILHPLFIGWSILLFVATQFLIPFVPNITPAVLGYASSIIPEEIVTLSNSERQAYGVPTLKLDSTLTQAALAKGADMFARNYWAHVAPDGTQPWAFFVASGYQYRYAGENLARDFYNSKNVVDAWMNSKTHRENLLSAKYEDIGIAVINGELDGVKTTLVVQFFGAKFGSAALGGEEVVSAAVLPPGGGTAGGLVAGTGIKPLNFGQLNEGRFAFLLSPFSSTKRIAIFLVSLFITILSIDMVVVKHKSVERRSSKSFAHFVFLGAILAALFAAQAGIIL